MNSTYSCLIIFEILNLLVPVKLTCGINIQNMDVKIQKNEVAAVGLVGYLHSTNPCARTIIRSDLNDLVKKLKKRIDRCMSDWQPYHQSRFRAAKRDTFFYECYLTYHFLFSNCIKDLILQCNATHELTTLCEDVVIKEREKFMEKLSLNVFLSEFFILVKYYLKRGIITLSQENLKIKKEKHFNILKHLAWNILIDVYYISCFGDVNGGQLDEKDTKISSFCSACERNENFVTGNNESSLRNVFLDIGKHNAKSQQFCKGYDGFYFFSSKFRQRADDIKTSDDEKLLRHVYNIVVKRRWLVDVDKHSNKNILFERDAEKDKFESIMIHFLEGFTGDIFENFEFGGNNHQSNTGDVTQYLSQKRSDRMSNLSKTFSRSFSKHGSVNSRNQKIDEVHHTTLQHSKSNTLPEKKKKLQGYDLKRENFLQIAQNLSFCTFVYSDFEQIEHVYMTSLFPILYSYIFEKQAISCYYVSRKTDCCDFRTRFYVSTALELQVLAFIKSTLKVNSIQKEEKLLLFIDLDVMRMTFEDYVDKTERKIVEQYKKFYNEKYKKDAPVPLDVLKRAINEFFLKEKLESTDIKNFVIFAKYLIFSIDRALKNISIFKRKHNLILFFVPGLHKTLEMYIAECNEYKSHIPESHLTYLYKKFFNELRQHISSLCFNLESKYSQNRNIKLIILTSQDCEIKNSRASTEFFLKYFEIGSRTNNSKI